MSRSILKVNASLRSRCQRPAGTLAGSQHAWRSYAIDPWTETVGVKSFNNAI